MGYGGAKDQPLPVTPSQNLPHLDGDVTKASNKKGQMQSQSRKKLKVEFAQCSVGIR